LQNKHEEYLLKVDEYVINDLITRQRESPLPHKSIRYKFFKGRVDSQKAKSFIFQKTAMMPAIYDNGTHHLTNQKLTVNMLKEISHSKDVWKLLANKVVASEDLIHPTFKA